MVSKDLAIEIYNKIEPYLSISERGEIIDWLRLKEIKYSNEMSRRKMQE